MSVLGELQAMKVLEEGRNNKRLSTTSMAEHRGKFSLLIFSCKIHHNLITIFVTLISRVRKESSRKARCSIRPSHQQGLGVKSRVCSLSLYHCILPSTDSLRAPWSLYALRFHQLIKAVHLEVKLYLRSRHTGAYDILMSALPICSNLW